MNGLKPVPGLLNMWATIYKPENKYIGRCGIYPNFNLQNRPISSEAALGLYIDKAWWGRGLATEAGRAFIDFGFNSLQINRIVTAIDTRNVVSVHVIEKLGFKLARTEEGNPRSFYHYILERESRNL